MKKLDTIGRDAFVNITNKIKNIPAKIRHSENNTKIIIAPIDLVKYFKRYL